MFRWFFKSQKMTLCKVLRPQKSFSRMACDICLEHNVFIFQNFAYSKCSWRSASTESLGNFSLWGEDREGQSTTVTQSVTIRAGQNFFHEKFICQKIASLLKQNIFKKSWSYWIWFFTVFSTTLLKKSKSFLNHYQNFSSTKNVIFNKKKNPLDFDKLNMLIMILLESLIKWEMGPF